MNVRRIKEEMQFMAGVITNDVDYLLYLLLKKESEVEVVSEVINTQDGGYMDDNLLEDWFNKL